LRVLQDQQIYKVGGRGAIPVDVRLIAATNKPLEEMVRDGEFREDLYYRINVIPIHIPPLRERIGDLESLAGMFLKKHSQRIGKKVDGIEPDALKAMKCYAWPGNVRELENAIEYAVHVSAGKFLCSGDLPKRLRSGVFYGNTVPSESLEAAVRVTLDAERSEAERVVIRSLNALEAEEIRRAIQAYGKSKAGIEAMTARLGISRATLYRKFKDYKL